MKFAIEKASDNKIKTIEINTLQELLELKNSLDYPIILYESSNRTLEKTNCKYLLQIYDDYIE